MVRKKNNYIHAKGIRGIRGIGGEVVAKVPVHSKDEACYPRHYSSESRGITYRNTQHS